MLHVEEGLWVGGATDIGNALAVGVKAILNVAQDLSQPLAPSWPKVEYAHIGLIDGPGNEIGDYCAAMLFLKALCRRCKKVLVYDHANRRALVVALMYLNLKEGQWRSDHSAWSHWPTWAERTRVVRNRVMVDLPEINEAHIETFDRKIPWGVLAIL